MKLTTILEICDDCPTSSEWEGGALTCRDLRGANGGPLKPCGFRRFAARAGSRCPRGKWAQDGLGGFPVPMRVRVGVADVHILPVA